MNNALSHTKRVIGTWTDSLLYTWRDRLHWRTDKSVLHGRRPLVSVIVPTLCKNQHAHRIAGLRELLQELLPRQVYDNYEALVISDGPNQLVRDLVRNLCDPRVSYYSTEQTSGFGGLPETTLGFSIFRGEYCLRMNDDNRPFPNYLVALLGGFENETDFAYARVIFSGEAREFWRPHFAGMTSYTLPNDRRGTIHANNVDWMSFMFRTETARSHLEAICRSEYGDWAFITDLITHHIPGRFVDRIVGHKN